MVNRLRGWRALALALASTVALSAAMVAPAGAVTDGTLDGNGHPFVGLMVAINEDGVPLWRCTGTLMSSDVFMTAGHCTEAPAAHVEIWFDAGPIPLDADYPASGKDPCKGIDGYPCNGDVGGTPYTHPQYNPNAFYLHDLGVVDLQGRPPVSQYGRLPGLNSLDGLPVGFMFTAVGYGLQKSFPVAAAWKNESTRVRMYANPTLLQYVGDFALLLTNNANTGGTCFGDSGGPNFVGTSNVVGAVTSFGRNRTCAGSGGVYRVDTADDLTWLATFGL